MLSTYFGKVCHRHPQLKGERREVDSDCHSCRLEREKIRKRAKRLKLVALGLVSVRQRRVRQPNPALAIARLSGERYFYGNVCVIHSFLNGQRRTSTSSCLGCEKERCREWRRRNRDKSREITREYLKTWRAKKPEQHRLSSRRWAQNNPDHARALSAQSKTKRKQASLGGIDREALVSLYKEARRLTREHGVKCHVDHIIPLKGIDELGQHVVCGLHVSWNLRIISPLKNLRKSNLFLETVL